MKKTRFTEAQIVSILHQQETGNQLKTLAENMGSAMLLFTIGKKVWSNANQ